MLRVRKYLILDACGEASLCLLKNIFIFEVFVDYFLYFLPKICIEKKCCKSFLGVHFLVAIQMARKPSCIWQWFCSFLAEVFIVHATFHFAANPFNSVLLTLELINRRCNFAGWLNTIIFTETSLLNEPIRALTSYGFL